MSTYDMIVYCFFISLVLSDELVAATSSVTTRDAFVTMLYHNHLLKDVGFELSVRVLGQSLRESKTVNEYVVLCLDDVPESTRRVLENDGWTVKSVDRLFTSSTHYNRHTTKVKLWLLEEYRRIVWLDADTIVVSNVDELFKCGKFCAVYRRSDQFNTGVIVVKPSKSEFDNIMKTFTNLIKQLHHRSGDQYVLNKHYENLKYTTMFNASVEVYHEHPMRLSGGYNGDVILYYVNNYWDVPSSEVKIIHYTMGFIKPTQWWSYLLFDLNWKWNELRERLPSRHNEPSVWDLCNWIPLIAITGIFVLLGCFGRILRRTLLDSHRSNLSRYAVYFIPRSWFATCFPLFAEFFSHYVAFCNVPTLMRPKEAWFMYGMWVTLVLVMTYIPYCYFLLLLGRYRMNLTTKIKICMYLLLYILIYVLFIYIPLKIVSFFQRFLAIVLIAIIWFVYGYIAGCHILKLCYKYTNLCFCKGLVNV